MFTPEDIQNRIRQQPFVPVRIVTSSGDSVDIYHADLVMIGRGSVMVGTPSNENPAHFEQVNRVAIVQITSLEDLPGGSPSPGIHMEFPTIDWLDHKAESALRTQVLVRVGKGSLVGFGIGWVGGMICCSGLMSGTFQRDKEGNILGFELALVIAVTAPPWGVLGGIAGWLVGLVGTKPAAYGALIGMVAGGFFTLVTHPFDGLLIITVPLHSFIGAFFGTIAISRFGSTSEPGPSPLKQRVHEPATTWGDVMSIVKGLLIIIASGLGFAVCFGTCGYALGRLVPDYYSPLFFLTSREPSIDPAAIGLGLGVTQGMFSGLFIGCLVVLAVSWYRSRRQVIDKDTPGVCQATQQRSPEARG